jgi:hypothetical protein
MSGKFVRPPDCWVIVDDLGKVKRLTLVRHGTFLPIFTNREAAEQFIAAAPVVNGVAGQVPTVDALRSIVKQLPFEGVHNVGIDPVAKPVPDEDADVSVPAVYGFLDFLDHFDGE